MNPLVSVIIPTYNRRNTLPRAVQSVLIQQRVSFEVLIIDDGSTDGTEQLIRENFPQAAYFYQANQGPSAARNRGIEKSRGEWLAFLDSDDEWMPGKLEAQIGFFSAADQNLNPHYRIAQTEEIWIRNGKRVNAMNKHKKAGGWIFEKCLPLCNVSPSAVMIHRSLFDEIGLFDESLPACEDYDLWLRIAAKNPIGLLETPYLIKYGGHADQTSRQFPAMDQFRIQALMKILKSGALTPEQAAAARGMLEEKSRIFIQGALKRGKQSEAEKLKTALFETCGLELAG